MNVDVPRGASGGSDEGLGVAFDKRHRMSDAFGDPGTQKRRQSTAILGKGPEAYFSPYRDLGWNMYPVSAAAQGSNGAVRCAQLSGPTPPLQAPALARTPQGVRAG